MPGFLADNHGNRLHPHHPGVAFVEQLQQHDLFLEGLYQRGQRIAKVPRAGQIRHPRHHDAGLGFALGQRVLDGTRHSLGVVDLFRGKGFHPFFQVFPPGRGRLGCAGGGVRGVRGVGGSRGIRSPCAVRFGHALPGTKAGLRTRCHTRPRRGNHGRVIGKDGGQRTGKRAQFLVTDVLGYFDQHLVHPPAVGDDDGQDFAAGGRT